MYPSFVEKMKSKIDSVMGKAISAKRIATAEPPFAHIRYVKVGNLLRVEAKRGFKKEQKIADKRSVVTVLSAIPQKIWFLAILTI